MLTFSTPPPWLAHFFAVAFGLVMGSFINVVVARLPRRESLVRPRSRCPQCQASIRWYDNLPVLSYVLLRGRCRQCKGEISIRYPVIESLVAILFLAMEVRFGLTPLLLLRDWPFAAICVAVTFIDLEHRIIPDRLSLGGLALGLLTSFLVADPGPLGAFVGALLGFAVFFGFAWFYERSTGRSGLGGGDVKFLAMLGAFLGPSGVFAVMLISSLLGSVLGISWALLSKQKNVMTVSIPYGPFLVIAGLFYYLLGDLLWPQFMTLT